MTVALYALVVDGEIVDGPRILPGAWGRVSGLRALPTRHLVDLGWWPVEEHDDDGPAVEVDVERRRVITRGAAA